MRNSGNWFKEEYPELYLADKQVPYRIVEDYAADVSKSVGNEFDKLSGCVLVMPGTQPVHAEFIGNVAYIRYPLNCKLPDGDNTVYISFRDGTDLDCVAQFVATVFYLNGIVALEADGKKTASMGYKGFDRKYTSYMRKVFVRAPVYLNLIAKGSYKMLESKSEIATPHETVLDTEKTETSVKADTSVNETAKQESESKPAVSGTRYVVEIPFRSRENAENFRYKIRSLGYDNAVIVKE